MNKTKPKKFTFRNEPRPTGLMAVGSGTPPINIKYVGVEVGLIIFNNHWNAKNGLGIQIRLMAPQENSGCQWKWVTLKRQFNSADEAKQFLNDNSEKISTMIYVRKDNL